MISILVDDPREMTIEQDEEQIEQLEGGYIANVFSICGAPLAKAGVVVESTDQWIGSRDTIRRRCGYGLLYEIARDK